MKEDSYRFHRKCVKCGRPFGTNGSGSMRCPKCVKEDRARYQRDLRAAKKAGKEAEEKVRKSRAKDSHCPYCGTPTRNGAFCGECLEWGNDLLYIQFGSTNGWDKPPKPAKVEVVDGWRGRVVTGGYARMK